MKWTRQGIVWSCLLVWGLAVASGCAPEFEEASCQIDSDCFDDEQCVEGICRLATGGGREADVGMAPEVSEGEGEPKVVFISPQSVAVAAGHQVRLHVTVLDGANNRLGIQGVGWASSDSSILEVSPASDGEGGEDRSVGVVTANSPGTARVTASVQGLGAEATIEVVETEVGELEISPKTPQIEIGGSVEMSAKVFDKAGKELTDRQVTWESTNTDIATVDGGTVQGVAAGQVEIVATSEGVEARTSLEVVKRTVGSVAITPGDPDALIAGDTLQLVAMPKTTDGSAMCSEQEATGTNMPCGRAVTWTSGASSVATVDDKGMVTTKGPGSVTIFAEIGGTTGTVDLEVNGANSAPTADAGPNITEPNGTQVTIDASGSSDPEGDALTYSWQITDAPQDSSATLGTPSGETVTLTPDVVGDYTVKLTVSDGSLNAEDDVVITALNRPPSVEAGSNITKHVGMSVSLDVTSSGDPDNQSLTYSWQLTDQPSGSSASLSGAATPSASLTPDVVGSYTVELTVDDGMSTATDYVVVTATNGAPSAVAGNYETTHVGTGVGLDASSSSDPDNDALSYSWAVTGEPSSGAGSLSNASTPTPTLTPSAVGQYTVEVTVDDGYATATDTILVEATNSAPVADAGADKTTTVGTQVSLDASIGSSDPDGDSLSYSWTMTPPSGSTETLGSNSGATTTLTPDVTGDYIVEVEVSDGYTTVTDTVTVTAQ